MKYRNLLIGAVLVFLILVLLGWNRLTGKVGGNWPGTAIECLPNGHQNLALHFHPHLTINVDGEPETVPTQIGITPTCLAEAHTHDDTGTIHAESIKPSRIFSLESFLAVWGEPFEREGFAATLTVDGQVVTSPKEVILRDSQQIVIDYQKVATTTSNGRD